MKTPQRSRPLLITCIIPVVMAALFAGLTGFNGLYGQDSFEYLRYSRSLHSFMAEGIPPGIFFWPVVYPLSGALLSFLLSDTLSLQLISLVCYGFTGWFILRILLQINPGSPRLLKVYVVLFFFLSPFVLRYAMTVMSELMAFCLISAALYAYFMFFVDRHPKYFFWMVSAAVAAGFTRYPAFIILAPPLVHALILFLRKFHPVYFVLTVAAAGILLVAELSLHGRWAGSVFGQPHFAGWSVMNFFRTTFETSDGHLEYKLPNILYVFTNLVHPGFIFAGAVLLLMLRKADAGSLFFKILLGSFFLYSLFLAGLTFQNDRVLLLTFPLVIILFSYPFIRLSSIIARLHGSYIVLIILLAVCIQTGLFYRAFLPFYKNSRTAKILAEEVKRYPGRVVYTFNAEQALKAYGVGNPVISMYPDKLDTFRINSLVLFNPDGSAGQWSGYNPMMNWEKLNTAYHLKKLKTLPDGWLLCEIGD
jgi:hypothetical protein